MYRTHTVITTKAFSGGRFRRNRPNLPFAIAKVRGTVAGNGGKMAVKQQQSSSNKASRRTTTAATRKKNSGKHRAPPATGKRSGRKHYDSSQQQPIQANVSELKPGEGGRKFISAFNQVVAVDSLEIAQAVVNKVKKGDINGARFLAEITGAKAQCNQPPQKPHRQLLAYSPDQLAAQPEWPDSHDPESDTGFGGREPEN